MFGLIQSWTFRVSVRELRDRRAIDRINALLRRVSLCIVEDARSVGDGVSEMLIN